MQLTVLARRNTRTSSCWGQETIFQSPDGLLLHYTEEDTGRDVGRQCLSADRSIPRHSVESIDFGAYAGPDLAPEQVAAYLQKITHTVFVK